MRFTLIYADKRRGLPRIGVFWGRFRAGAAEVRSAEATELPVWKRPPVSVAKGLCHPRDWIPGHAVHADLRGKDADWRSGDVLLLGWRDRLSVLP